MATLILLNKPFRVMPQFTDDAGRNSLADYIQHPGVYPAGRLDYDSEGLILLTDNGRLQQRIADPAFKLEKTYWVQVEGEISVDALQQLAAGVSLNDGPTRPAAATRIAPPEIWPRNPPVRYRKAQPTSWIELKIREGRNRQVRRMTAAVGFPTLRLIRIAIGEWRLGNLQPGEFKTLCVNMPTTSQTRRKRNHSPASHSKSGRRSNNAAAIQKARAPDRPKQTKGRRDEKTR